MLLYCFHGNDNSSRDNNKAATIASNYNGGNGDCDVRGDNENEYDNDK